MVYKKYHKKGGKTFGPYYYKSFRDGDKVKKIYIGGEKAYGEWKKKKDRKNKKSSVEQPRKIRGGNKKDFLGMPLFFRDKMLKELQSQYKGELRRQMKLIECKRDKDNSLLKTPEEKREYRREVKEIKRLRKIKLGEVKEEKIREFKEIKKKFKGSLLKRRLAEWKKKGYDTQVLEKKYKMPSVKSIRARVSEWKRKGYDTSLLEKKTKK